MGEKLQILADSDLLDSVIERMFQDWDATKAEGGNKEKLQAILESKGTELGLPPSESNEAVALLYDQIFTEVGEEMLSGNLDRGAFQEAVKGTFKKLADQLEANPVFIELES